MTTLRLAYLTSLIFVFGSTSLIAAPTYTAYFAPPPGPSIQYGSNASYQGPNNLGGVISTSGGGIVGSDTPLNSGQSFSASYLVFSVNGQTGQIQIVSDFVGTIIDSNINAIGGTADFVGHFDDAAAAFFGVSTTTEVLGTMTLQLGPAEVGGPDAYLASAKVVIGPGVAVPEPSSLVLLTLGCLGGVAVTGRTRRSNQPNRGESLASRSVL